MNSDSGEIDSISNQMQQVILDEGTASSSFPSSQCVQAVDGTAATQQASQSQPSEPAVRQEDAKQRLMLVQQELIYLLHAYKCGKEQQRSNSPACSVPNCAHHKHILLHISNCTSQICNCTYYVLLYCLEEILANLG